MDGILDSSVSISLPSSLLLFGSMQEGRGEGGVGGVVLLHSCQAIFIKAATICHSYLIVMGRQRMSFHIPLVSEGGNALLQ